MISEVIQPKIGIWSQIDEIKDPKLRRLATLLPQNVLGALSENTNRSYAYGAAKWRNWANNFNRNQWFYLLSPCILLYI